MKLPFAKYHGTGNDFIIVDNRDKKFPVAQSKFISNLCHRRFGIGADGLILLERDKTCDFKMVYFNSDGKEGSLCGNGSRCIVAYASKMKWIKKETIFMASDGAHLAEVVGHVSDNVTMIRVKMKEVSKIEKGRGYVYLNTGSPHYVLVKKNLNKLEVVKEAHKIRYNKRFSKVGTNVDFIAKKSSSIEMRVYERGVEEETYSSGTGAVASAIAASVSGLIKSNSGCNVYTKGGILNVQFKKTGSRFSDIWLEGPATFVCQGEIIIPD